MFRNALNHMLDIRDLKRAEREGKEDGGFTLIELLVVVVIIGILIAIAIPLYLNYTKGAKDKGAESDIRGAVAAVQQCYTDNDNEFPATGTQTAAGDDLTFVGCDSVAKASDGTVLTYTLTADKSGYTITGTTSGSDKTYEYDSSVGKVELQPAGN